MGQLKGTSTSCVCGGGGGCVCTKVWVYLPVIQAYINDALTTRLWVDLEQCKKLVDNIVTIFHTTTSGNIITPSSLGEH